MTFHYELKGSNPTACNCFFEIFKMAQNLPQSDYAISRNLSETLSTTVHFLGHSTKMAFNLFVTDYFRLPFPISNRK